MTLDGMKRTLEFLLVLFFLTSTVRPVSEFYNNLKMQHDFHVKTGVGIKTKHTTCYNMDPKEAELAYMTVRELIGVNYVNDHVKIIHKTNLWKDGAIGKIGKNEVIGVQCDGTIIYDGNPLVLRHELAHFFFARMVDGERSEMFAQSVEKTCWWVYKYRKTWAW